MSKVIDGDIIAKIAELAGRGHSKSAVARQLDLDRATVRKYWPAEKEESESKTAEVKLPLRDEFRLITTRNELGWDIGATLNKIEKRRWETHELRKQGRLATQSLKFLREKVEKAKTLGELDELSSLGKQEQEKLEPALNQDDKLLKKRLEQEEKGRKERGKKWSESYDTFKQAEAVHVRRVFPCKREFAEALVVKFEDRYGLEQGLDVLGKLLEYVEWELKVDGSLVYIGPLVRECSNIILGNEKQKDSIREIVLLRRERILKPPDELYAIFDEWLASEDAEEFTGRVLKLNAALLQLAHERYVDIQDIFADETGLTPGR